MTKLQSILARFRKDEEGLTLVEYGIGAILGVTVGAIALTGLGNEIVNELGQADAVMQATGGGTIDPAAQFGTVGGGGGAGADAGTN